MHKRQILSLWLALTTQHSLEKQGPSRKKKETKPAKNKSFWSSQVKSGGASICHTNVSRLTIPLPFSELKTGFQHKSTGSSLEAFLQETRALAQVETVAQLCHYNVQLTSMQDIFFLRRAPILPKKWFHRNWGFPQVPLSTVRKHAQSQHFLAQGPVSWDRSIHQDKARRGFCVHPTFFSLGTAMELRPCTVDTDLIIITIITVLAVRL